MSRSQIQDAGVTRAGLKKNYILIEYGMYVHREILGGQSDQVTPPLRSVPATALVLAHARRHPRRIATGFAAAAVKGMRYFVDEEPLGFLAPKSTSDRRSPDHIKLYPTRRLDSWWAEAVSGGDDPTLKGIACTPPGTTLAYMLRELRRQDESRDLRWQVPDLTPVRACLTPNFIRSVQTSDAFHQALGKEAPGDPGAVLAARVVSTEDAVSVLGATDVGAESPPETLLRLVVADLAPGLRSQIPVWRDDGSLLTVVDLGWEEHRVFLFYDGQHHLHRTQRDHDSEVLAVLQYNGGRVLRVTAGDLRTVASVEILRDRVAVALGLYR
jgi:hypothetical protein